MPKNCDTLTIALSKGKLLSPAIDLLARIGVSVPTQSEDSRSLIFENTSRDTIFLIIRPTDVPTYVECGSADIGIVGKDVLLEQESDVYEPLDLKFGQCKVVLAGPQEAMPREEMGPSFRIATKYPNITEQYFSQKGESVEVIKLYGSIELAPLVGLSERIVDLVSTGKTLHAHKLIPIETVTESSARLIVNQASLALKHQRVLNLINLLKTEVQRGSL
mgnify:CR=1 FL=1|tara:strand:- start:2603 stop:3259 length:657 start_codon:yes stop_codon:yes gene_type:complete